MSHIKDTLINGAALHGVGDSDTAGMPLACLLGSRLPCFSSSLHMALLGISKGGDSSGRRTERMQFLLCYGLIAVISADTVTLTWNCYFTDSSLAHTASSLKQPSVWHICMGINWFIQFNRNLGKFRFHKPMIKDNTFPKHLPWGSFSLAAHSQLFKIHFPHFILRGLCLSLLTSPPHSQEYFDKEGSSHLSWLSGAACKGQGPYWIHCYTFPDAFAIFNTLSQCLFAPCRFLLLPPQAILWSLSVVSLQCLLNWSAIHPSKALT